MTPRSGDGGGDRRIRCEGHCPPPLSGGKQKTRSPVGSDDVDDANVHDGDGDDDAGGGGIVRRNSTVYARVESAGLWRDDGNRTRRWTTVMCLLDCMGGMTTTPSLLLRGIEDHDGGLSSS